MMHPDYINKITFSIKGHDCSSFEVNFFGDGRVTKEVWFPYDEIGFFEGEFLEFDHLAQLILKLDFFNLDDTYERFVCDGATVKCTVETLEYHKTVEDTTQGEIPEIWALELVVTGLIEQIEWEKRNDK